MSYEDERIVKMTFDHEAFKKGVSETIEALNTLEKSLKNIDAGTSYKSFDKLTESVNYTDKAFSNVDQSVNKVKASFSAMQVVGMTVLSELTRSAMSFGKTIWNNTLGQIKSGGTARALNIEAAKFQLEGLGVAWNDIYGDIDYAVKGTAYGLDEAAKAASQLSASQVKLGDDMKQALRAISGVAAMTNSQYTEIANVFTTVAANGKLMTMQLRQLSARGLNVSAVLAEQLNKTEAEINDMVSKGKISFAEFAHAMDSAFGEHAKEANKTFTGALSNMKAALSRIGEKFATPWHEMERVIFTSVTPVIDKIGSVVKLLAPDFSYITRELSSWVQNLTKSYSFNKGILNIAMGIYSYIWNISKALSDLGIHLPDILDIGKSFEDMTDGFILQGERAEHFRDIITTIAKAFIFVGNVVKMIFNIMKPLISMTINFLKNLVNNTNGIADKLASFVFMIANVIALVGEFIIMNIPNIINGITNAIKIAAVVLSGIIIVIKSIGDAIHWIVMRIVGFVDSFRDNAKVIIHNVEQIHKAFWKFVTKVGDIFKSIGDSILEFVSDTDSGAKALSKTVSNMFKDKIMKAKVILSVDTPALSPTDVVKKNTTKAMTSAANAASSYSSAIAMSTSNVSKFGAVGGHLSGAFGAKDIVGATAALKQYQEESKKAQKETENTSTSFAAMASGLEKSVADMSLAVGGKNPLSKKLFNHKEVEHESETFIDKVKSHFTKMRTKLDDITSRISEHVSNIFNVINDAIIAGSLLISVGVTIASVKILKSIFNTLTMIPDLLSGLTNLTKGFKYQGIAEALKSLSLCLLAFGAVLLTIAIISKFVDIESFKTVMKYSLLMMGMAAVLLHLMSVIYALNGIISLIKTMPGTSVLTKMTVNTNALGNFFKGLAIMLGTIVGSLMTIYITAQIAGGYKGIITSAFIVAGLLLSLALAVKIMAGAIGPGSNMTKQLASFDLKTMKITQESTNAFGGIVTMLLALSPLLLSIGIAVSMIAKQNFGKTIAAFVMITSMMQMVFGAIAALLLFMNHNVLPNKSVDETVLTKTLNSTITSVSKIIFAVSVFMLSITAAISVLSFINPEKAWRSFGILGISFTIISTLISGIMVWSYFMQKQAKSPTELEASGANIDKTLSGVSILIQSIASAMIMVAASMAIVSMIPADKLWSSAGVLWISMGIMTLVVGMISAALFNFNKQTSSGKGNNSKASSLAITQMHDSAKQISTIINSMSMLLISVSAALSLIGMIKNPYKALGALSGAMAVIGLIIMTLSVICKDFKSFQGPSKQLSTAFDSDAATSISKLIFMMSAFVMSVSGSLYLVSLIDAEKLNSSVGALIVTMLGITAALAGFALILNYMLKSTSSLSDTSIASKIQSFCTALLAIIGSIIALSSMILILAVAFDSVEDPNRIMLAMGTMAGIMIALGVMLYAITKITNSGQLPDAKELAGLAAIVAGISVVLFTIAVVCGMLADVDWSAFDKAWPYLLGFAGFIVIFTAVLAVVGKTAAAAIKGIAIIGAVFLAISVIIFAAGYLANSIAKAIDSLSDSMVALTNVPWNNVKQAITQFKDCMTTIIEALSQSLMVSISAVLFGYALKLITNAITAIDNTNLDALKTFAEAMKSFAEIVANAWKPMIAATAVIAIFSMIGPMIVAGVATLLVAIALLPLVVYAADFAFKLIESKIDELMTSMKHAFDSIFNVFKEIYAELDTFGLDKLMVFAFGFLVFGALMSIAGTELIVAALTILIAGKLMVLSGDDLIVGMKGYSKAIRYVDLDLINGTLGLIIFASLMTVAASFIVIGALSFLAASAFILLSGLALSKAAEYSEYSL